MRAEIVILALLTATVSSKYSASALLSKSYICDGVSDDSLVLVSRDVSVLDTFVGENVVKEILYDEDCDLDFECISRYMGTLIKTAFRIASGLTACLVVLVGFLIFSPCLCSRRYRQLSIWGRMGEREHPKDYNTMRRRIYLAGSVFFCIIVVVDVIFIAMQKQTAITGMRSALCETYKFLNQTMNGGSAVAVDSTAGYSFEAQFPGFNNVTALVADVSLLVAPNGTALNLLEDLMNRSVSIEKELGVLQQWFTTVGYNMFKNTQSYYHDCIFCTNFSSYPNDTKQAYPTNPSMLSVNNSLASVLSYIGSELKPLVLTGSLYSSLTTASKALKSYGDELFSLIYPMILDNLSLIFTAVDYFNIFTIVLLCVTGVPLLLIIHLVTRRMFHTGRTSPTFIVTSIYITLIYTILSFLLSAVILLAGYGLGSVCLVLNDAESAISDLSFRFGYDSMPDVVVGITRQCLRPETDGDILKGIVISGDSTVRDKINTLVTISGNFVAINDAIATGGLSNNLSSNVYINNLGRYMDSVGDLYLITERTKSRNISQIADYKPTTSSAQIYDKTVYSAPQCQDRTVSVHDTPPGVLTYLKNYEFDEIDNEYVIPGFSAILNTLNQNHVDTGITQCPSAVTASKQMIPWGNLLNLKLAFMNKNFQCALPNVTMNSSTLELKFGMTKTVCNQTGYRDYMRSFKEKVIDQATKVDEAVATHFDTILDSIWSLLNDQLMGPVQEVSSALNCQFVAARWNALFQSFCMTFTPSVINFGKIMFSLGFAGVCSLILEIIVWRHLKDNRCLREDAAHSVVQYRQREGYWPASVRRVSVALASAMRSVLSRQPPHGSQASQGPSVSILQGIHHSDDQAIPQPSEGPKPGTQAAEKLS